MSAPVRVAVVDDHPVTVDGLRAALAAEDGIDFAGSGSTRAEALSFARSGIDVLVCDVALGEDATAGLDLLSELDAGAARVLLLTAHDYPGYLRTSIERGAAGFLPKSVPTARLAAAVREVAAGGAVFSLETMRRARSAPRPPTARETQVIALVAEGSSNDEVAELLGLGRRTVESHLRRLFDRYGVESRTALAALARREGWTRS